MHNSLLIYVAIFKVLLLAPLEGSVHVYAYTCLYTWKGNVSLCSGGDGLRYEELPGEWFDYNKAFPTVTDFYGSSTSSSSSSSSTPTETVTDGETSPSACSMDTTKVAEGMLYMYIHVQMYNVHVDNMEGRNYRTHTQTQSAHSRVSVNVTVLAV